MATSGLRALVLPAVLLHLCFCVSGLAGEDGAQGADLWIVAPSAKTAAGTNLLPIEAAMRAVAAEMAGRGLRVVFVTVDQADQMPSDAWPRLRTAGRGSAGPNSVRFSLSVSQEKALDPCEAVFERTDWESLVKSVSKARDVMVAHLETHFKPVVKGKDGALYAHESAVLDAAFEDICSQGPSAALAVSPKVDLILNARPRLAETLTAACWPSCIIATQDLQGHFQLRDRVLAVPLGFWIQAEKAGALKTERGKLTGAWVALLCGFPKSALELVRQTSEETSQTPLARAITVFATRDWRLLDGEGIQEATAVEQLAWLWAIQECMVFSPRLPYVAEIMSSRWGAAFGPVYDVQSVEAGHAFTSAMLATSAAGAVYDLTRCPALTSKSKQDMLESVARRYGLDPSALGPQLLFEVCDAVYSAFGDDEFEAADVTAVEKALTDASRLLEFPWESDAEARLCSLPTWSYAQPARGLFYQSLQLRAKFLDRHWSVPEMAKAFLAKLDEGIRADAGIRSFFAAYLYRRREELYEAGEAIKGSLKTEIGASAPQWYLHSLWTDPNWLEEAMRKAQRVYHHPCGAWECRMCVSTMLDSPPTDASRNWYRLILQNDPWSIVRSRAAKFENAGDDHLIALAKSMPYHNRLIMTLGTEAQNARRAGLAARLLELSVDQQQDYVLTYKSLAEAYAKSGEIDKAIETLVEGCSKGPDTLSKCAAMSLLARLLRQKGRIDEAVFWAARGARAGSSDGLITYGHMLGHAGRHQEALEVYRRAADRYASCVYYYLVYCFLCDVPADRIAAEARAFAERRPESRFVETIAGPLMMYGQFDLAAELLEGSLRPRDAVELEMNRGTLYLMKQDFEQAASHYRAGTGDGYFFKHRAYFPVNTAVRTWIAAHLAADGPLRKLIEDVVTEPPNCPEWAAPCLAAMNGDLSEEEALKRAAEEDLPQINLYWIFAARAEYDGQIDKAINWYSRAVEDPEANWTYAGRFSRERLKTLKKLAEPPEGN